MEVFVAVRAGVLVLRGIAGVFVTVNVKDAVLAGRLVEVFVGNGLLTGIEVAVDGGGLLGVGVGVPRGVDMGVGVAG